MPLISVYMGCINDRKPIIMEVEVNLYDKPCVGRLCPTGIPRPSLGYKKGASI